VFTVKEFVERIVFEHITIKMIVEKINDKKKEWKDRRMEGWKDGRMEGLCNIKT